MTTDEFLELYPTYLASRDPTEYTFALRAFGGYQAWETISKQKEFIPIVDAWRRELAAKLRSESLSRIIEAAQGETRDALAANKYIYETLDKGTSKAGRPTRESILKEAHKLVEDDKAIEEAYKRIIKQES
jgi:hypothetical protein